MYLFPWSGYHHRFHDGLTDLLASLTAHVSSSMKKLAPETRNLLAPWQGKPRSKRREREKKRRLPQPIHGIVPCGCKENPQYTATLLHSDPPHMGSLDPGPQTGLKASKPQRDQGGTDRFSVLRRAMGQRGHRALLGNGTAAVILAGRAVDVTVVHTYHISTPSIVRPHAGKLRWSRDQHLDSAGPADGVDPNPFELGMLLGEG
ncbi:hypothetical protein F5141DRAFT_1062329 [Pisolithus sp. B1]|nr:hypothetical protein F5141DRAFT_1062329 [Pisolithus sp. B1]